MKLWYIMYDILGIALISGVSIFIWRIFIVSNNDKFGIARST